MTNSLTTAGAPNGKGGGCLKWGAILGSSFLLFIGLVSACSPETVETEIPGPTITQTTTVTPPTKTVTETITPTPEIEPTTAESTSETPEQAAIDVDTNPAAVDVDEPQRFASIPDRAPTPAPAATFYQNCAAVRAAGAAPIYAGSPGYSSKLDRDGDGVACE